MDALECGERKPSRISKTVSKSRGLQTGCQAAEPQWVGSSKPWGCRAVRTQAHSCDLGSFQVIGRMVPVLQDADKEASQSVPLSLAKGSLQ